MNKPAMKSRCRLARWLTPWRLTGQSYLRLHIEDWCRADGTLGWGTSDAPFPGQVTIEVLEVDSPEEGGKDEVIGRFVGTFVRHPDPRRRSAAEFKVTQAHDHKNRRISAGRQSTGTDGGEHVWVAFEGCPDRYRLPFPPAGMEEGPMFELSFRILHPAMDGETEYGPKRKDKEPGPKHGPKAVVRRPRGVVLPVEPLCQGSVNLNPKSARDQGILQEFHGGATDTINRSWKHIVFRYRLSHGNHGRFGPAGCSITAFTMVMRTLRHKGSSISVYDAAMLAYGPLQERSRPFEWHPSTAASKPGRYASPDRSPTGGEAMG